MREIDDRIIALRNPELKEISVKKIAVAVLFALTCSLSANAVVTEIRQDFLNQTSLLAPTAIMSAPASNATYIVFSSISPATGPLFAQFAWTDENGDAQSSYQNVVVMHVEAGTAPTVQAICNGTCSSTYNLFVTGFGLWSSGTQGQGGITEPISSDHYSLTSLVSNQVLLTPAAEGTYLVTADITNNAGASLYSTVSWTDEFGAETGSLFAGEFLSVHSLAGDPITLSTVLNFGTLSSYDLHVRGIYFGTPSSGSGPLADTELNLIGWTSATYPTIETVLTAPSSAEYILVSNMEESGTCGLNAYFYWNGAEQVALSAPYPDAPASMATQRRLLGSTSYRFFTTTWIPNGSCQDAYSIETAAIQF